MPRRQRPRAIVSRKLDDRSWLPNEACNRVMLKGIALSGSQRATRLLKPPTSQSLCRGVRAPGMGGLGTRANMACHSHETLSNWLPSSAPSRHHSVVSGCAKISVPLFAPSIVALRAQVSGKVAFARLCSRAMSWRVPPPRGLPFSCLIWQKKGHGGGSFLLGGGGRS